MSPKGPSWLHSHRPGRGGGAGVRQCSLTSERLLGLSRGRGERRREVEAREGRGDARSGKKRKEKEILW